MDSDWSYDESDSGPWSLVPHGARKQELQCYGTALRPDLILRPRTNQEPVCTLYMYIMCIFAYIYILYIMCIYIYILYIYILYIYILYIYIKFVCVCVFPVYQSQLCCKDPPAGWWLSHPKRYHSLRIIIPFP